MTQDTKTFEEWEKIPSTLKLTNGECNQLYNILTTVDLPKVFGEGADINRILVKLEREI